MKCMTSRNIMCRSLRFCDRFHRGCVWGARILQDFPGLVPPVLLKHAKHAKGEPRKNLESVADTNEQRAYGRLLGNMRFNGGEAKHNRDLILEHFRKS